MHRPCDVEALEEFNLNCLKLLPKVAARKEVSGVLAAVARGDDAREQDDVDIYHVHVILKVPQPVRVLLGIGVKRGIERGLAIDIFFVPGVLVLTPPERVRDARLAWNAWQP